MAFQGLQQGSCRVPEQQFPIISCGNHQTTIKGPGGASNNRTTMWGRGGAFNPADPKGLQQDPHRIPEPQSIITRDYNRTTNGGPGSAQGPAGVTFD